MMQQGRVLDVMEKAASNANGSANGFMGLGMFNMVSSGMGNAVMQNAFSAQPVQPQQQAQPEQQVQPQPENTVQSTEESVDATQTGIPSNDNSTVTASNEWVCPTCGSKVVGKFCGECGTKKPEENVCPNCGSKVSETAKFCGECGTKVR